MEYKNDILKPKTIRTNKSLKQQRDMFKEFAKNNKEMLEREDKGFELLSKRNKREKHFLQKDGKIVAEVFTDDIHFEKDGKFEEIDNTLIKDLNYYKNKSNDYTVYLKNESSDKLMKYEFDNNIINIELLDCNIVPISIIETDSKYTKMVKYNNIYQGIDLEYIIASSKVKENIIINNKESFPKQINFKLTSDLELQITEKGKVEALKNTVPIFTFDVPYMIDSNMMINENVFYKITKVGNNEYLLSLYLDDNWAKKEEIVYPIIVDPTVTTYNSGTVNDTYISSGNANTNYSNESTLVAGVKRNNNTDSICRTLVKCSLPHIGTGSQIYEAFMTLISYPITSNDWQIKSAFVDAHRITSEWSETSATWNNMNDKYDSRIEASGEMLSSLMDTNQNIYQIFPSAFNITPLVKKWYSGTPNYGIMIKAHKEIYNPDYIPTFFSQNSDVDGLDPKPTLRVVYRNQSGTEDYMDLQSQSFTGAEVYENTFNGNIIANFELGETLTSDYPAELNLIYNTNDVVLGNNIGFGLGFKLNVWQTIKKVTIDQQEYLEYYDEDGTLHYFILEDGVYVDEDNLNMTIDDKTTYYVLKDSDGNKMTFNIVNNVGYLTTSEDNDGNTITINYNSENKITKLTDNLGYEITITYESDKILVNSPCGGMTLNYENGQLKNLTSITGSTLLSYNNNSLISKITDMNGTSIGYTYYDAIPYRVKKVTEYGISDELGNSFELIYGNKNTTIKDNKGRITVIEFNESGNAISTNDITSEDSIVGAYGTVYGYFDYPGYRNRLYSSKIPVKYVKNYLKNISFENEGILFTNSNNSNIIISDDCANSGKKSLKITNSDNNECIYQSVSVPKGNFYTFSAYVKNTNNIALSLEYDDASSNLIQEISDTITLNQDFNRYDVTIYYPEDAVSSLKVKICLLDIGTTYIDDVQLEQGEVANYFNYIENSDFSDGLNNWDYGSRDNGDRFEVVNLPDGCKALKVKMDPENDTYFGQVLNIGGNAGDTYNLSFWYKNNGIIPGYYNSATIGFNNLEEEDYGHCIEPISLNPNDTSWQYFSVSYTSEHLYDTVYANFFQDHDANELYITNVSLFKGTNTQQINYDDDGNVNGLSDLRNKTISFDYDVNNQITNITHYDGKKTYFEYDNTHKDRLLSKINRNGIVERYKYDSFGNQILKRIIKTNAGKDIDSGIYQIRAKGTEKYIRNINYNPQLKEDSCGHDKWLVEKINDDYAFRHSINENKYLSVYDTTLTMSKFSESKSLFSLTKNNNGSYYLNIKNENKYLKNNNGKLEISNWNSDDSNFYEFYIEQIEDGKFIEASAEYTSDGRFPVSSQDTNFHKMYYDVDTNTGLIKTKTDPKGNKTYYTYNTNQQITSQTDGNKNIRYTYNNLSLLEKIVQGEKTYKFVYDEFLNARQVKVGDNITLVTNNYENNNGNLQSVVYGNNNEISYEYDSFDRIVSQYNMDDTYHLKYGNNGDLVKIISNTNIERYNYDYGKRLNEYKLNNEFKVKYKYNDNNDIIETDYNLQGNNENIQNTLDDQGAITKSIFDNQEIDYQYDSIGRMALITINNDYKTHYSYITNGKRTSAIVKALDNNGDKYSYKYDKSNNVTHIYHNGVLETQYYYNRYNELIREDNYLLNKTIKYTYNQYGNILSQKFYNLNSHQLLEEKNYKYSNSNWIDQLTSYDEKTLTYDEVGNPLTYGNIQLSWINGRQLHSYSDSNNEIVYKYNRDGLRTSKTINGVETKYYLEKDDIIFEKTNNNVIYYIRNDVDDLVGFKYNDDIYYYIKNHFGDIIGILNHENIIVAKYAYGSYGNILSITDGNNNDVSNNDMHIANINPFRYRGYYYDKETKLYYLKSRYYNPEWGRFINADGMISSDDGFDNNMYAYALNNPINNIDPDGRNPFAVVLGAVLYLYNAYDAYKKWKKKKNVKNTINLIINVVPATAVLSKAAKIGKAASSGKKVVNAVSAGKKVSTTKKTVTRTTNTPKSIPGKWTPGESITKMTYKGNPTWATVRSRYWKNEAYFNSANYKASELERMRKGKPPLTWDTNHNKWMSMELHHNPAQWKKVPDPHSIDKLQPYTPYEHALHDKFRRRTYGEKYFEGVDIPPDGR